VYGTRELVLHRHYLAFYRVRGEEVHILTVLRTARQWP
jgi:plasmid stabilization system protein ParE